MALSLKDLITPGLQRKLLRLARLKIHLSVWWHVGFWQFSWMAQPNQMSSGQTFGISLRSLIISLPNKSALDGYDSYDYNMLTPKLTKNIVPWVCLNFLGKEQHFFDRWSSTSHIFLTKSPFRGGSLPHFHGGSPKHLRTKSPVAFFPNLSPDQIHVRRFSRMEMGQKIIWSMGFYGIYIWNLNIFEPLISD